MNQQPDHLGLLGVPGGGYIHRVLPLVKLSVLLVSVAAAVPTARNLYYSWTQDIPFSQVSHRLTQYELWMKNIDCRIEYRALSTATGGRIDAGACAKTGDIAIKITGPRGSTAYEWIAHEQLQKPQGQTTSLINFLIPPAQAEPKPASPGPLLQLAQSGMEVLCQARQGDKIVRVVKDGGKCFREVVSPLKGRIEQRGEVACTTKC
jgi:hypothetical protein